MPGDRALRLPAVSAFVQATTSTRPSRGVTRPNPGHVLHTEVQLRTNEVGGSDHAPRDCEARRDAIERSS